MSGPLKLVAGGVDVRRVATDENAVTFDRAGNRTGTRTSEGNQTFLGLFGEASVSPLEKLEVLLSARLNSWRNAGGREQSGTGEPREYEDASATRLDPRLSLRYGLGRGFAVRGAVYGRFARRRWPSCTGATRPGRSRSSRTPSSGRRRSSAATSAWT